MISFAPSGKSIVLAYADDSTEASTAVAGATKFLVVNPDAANVVVVSVGFNNNDTDAIVPTSGANGSGTVIAPASQVVLEIPQAAYAATVWISVAGVSATGNVYITPGA